MNNMNNNNQSNQNQRNQAGQMGAPPSASFPLSSDLQKEAVARRRFELMHDYLESLANTQRLRSQLSAAEQEEASAFARVYQEDLVDPVVCTAGPGVENEPSESEQMAQEIFSRHSLPINAPMSILGSPVPLKVYLKTMFNSNN